MILTQNTTDICPWRAQEFHRDRMCRNSAMTTEHGEEWVRSVELTGIFLFGKKQLKRPTIAKPNRHNNEITIRRSYLHNSYRQHERHHLLGYSHSKNLLYPLYTEKDPPGNTPWIIYPSIALPSVQTWVYKPGEDSNVLQEKIALASCAIN